MAELLRTAAHTITTTLPSHWPKSSAAPWGRTPAMLPRRCDFVKAKGFWCVSRWQFGVLRPRSVTRVHGLVRALIRTLMPTAHFGPRHKAPGPNRWIIDELQQLISMYQSTGIDQYKKMNLQRVIGALKKLDERGVALTEDALQEFCKQVNKCGAKTEAKLREILQTGGLERVKHNDTPEARARVLFARVYGIGDSKAADLVNRNFRTLEEVLAAHRDAKAARRPSPISDAASIGIELLDHFEQRIPRDEVTALAAYVRAEAEALFPGVQCTVCGSYRRGKASSGDMDVLVTHPTEPRWTDSPVDSDSSVEVSKELFCMLIRRLVDKGFLTHHLTASYPECLGLGVQNMVFKRDTACSGTQPHAKYMGMCRLPGNRWYRRIDILVVPPVEFGAALMYFTGSAFINRSMRALARKKGWSLSQHGLRRNVVRKNGVVVSGEIIPGLVTERDYFTALGLAYLEPEDRSLEGN